MDFNAREGIRYPNFVHKILRRLHGRTAEKMLAVVALLLLSPLLALTSGGDLSAEGQTENGLVAGTAATTAINEVTIVASPSIAYVGEEITFFANATSSNVGSNLTITIFYDYYNLTGINEKSAVSVINTTSPATVVTTHTYMTTGNYSDASSNYFFWAIAYAYDGTDNLSSIPIQVYVNYNDPPMFRMRPLDPLEAAANQNRSIVTYICDNDTDTVTVTWDFGDGTNATNVTVAPPWPGGIYVNQTHIWSPKIPGNPNYIILDLSVSLSDGHNPPVTSITKVNLSLPRNYPPFFNISAPTQASPLQPVTFSANASDPEGDPLTWTFNYSDGLTRVYHTNWSAPNTLIWQNDTREFTSEGVYLVNISISDALIPYQISYHNNTLSTSIHVKTNVPPRAYPIIINPTAPEINATIGYVDASCSIDVFDEDRDILTLTWHLNGAPVGTNITGGEGDYAKYTHIIRFNDTGTYNISVTVTDGIPGHELTLYKIVNITSNNLPPAVLVFKHDKFAEGNFASPNETLKFHLVASDPEKDTLFVIWDFGDGSDKVYMNLTDYDASGNVSVNINHTYVKVGNYTVRIIVTDNKMGVLNHTLYYDQPIKVAVRPPKIVIRWDWWDYTSLGLVLMIPVSMISWYFRMRSHHAKLDAEGISYDEYKLRRELMAEAQKKK